MSVDTASLRAIAEAATPGRRFWRGNTKSRNIELATYKSGEGQYTILRPRRAGMQGATFQFNVDGWMHPAEEFPIFEVAKDATSGDDPKVYRHDIVGIRHPDADFIAAASPPAVLELLDEIDRLRGNIENALGLLDTWTWVGERADVIETLGTGA